MQRLSTRRANLHPTPWLLLAALVALSGCGPSVEALVRRGQLFSACERHSESGSEDDGTLAKLFDRADLKLSLRSLDGAEALEVLSVGSMFATSSAGDPGRDALVELRLELQNAPAPVRVRVLNIKTATHSYSEVAENRVAALYINPHERRMESPKPGVEGLGKTALDAAVGAVTLGQRDGLAAPDPNAPLPFEQQKKIDDDKASKLLSRDGLLAVVSPGTTTKLYAQMTPSKHVTKPATAGVTLRLDYLLGTAERGCTLSVVGYLAADADVRISAVLRSVFGEDGRLLGTLKFERIPHEPVTSYKDIKYY